MVNHIRERREAVGVTQQRLADLAGCSRSMVRFFEAGYEPSRRSVVRAQVERVLEELERRQGSAGVPLAPGETARIATASKDAPGSAIRRSA